MVGKHDGDQGGRPETEIDMGMLTDLVRIQCTAEECASILHCSIRTIDRRLVEQTGHGFVEFHKKHSGEGKASLRRAQYQAATKDLQPTMLVWLGKQWLGQTDKIHTNLTSSDGSMSPGTREPTPEEIDARIAHLQAVIAAGEDK